MLCTPQGWDKWEEKWYEAPIRVHLSDKKDEWDAKKQMRRLSNALEDWEAAHLASAEASANVGAQ